jgi:proteasome lid subunit RPN8/RPN11
VKFEVAQPVWRALEAHAIETYPDECCGVLIGTSGGTELVRIRNIQDEMHSSDPARYPRTARTAYAGHPGDLRDALARSEIKGHRLVAFYHSHPDHAAYFSDEDVRQATPFGEPSYPEALQIVVSVSETGVGEIKAFGWSPDLGSYAELEVRICAA